MADTKQSKTVGEHHVCACLARYGWAPALTRDGLERTDILAVDTGDERQMIEVQVKAIRGDRNPGWLLGTKALSPARSVREWYVLVAIHPDPTEPLRSFVMPRDHVAAATWISHQHWLTEPGIPPGRRNAPLAQARVTVSQVQRYEGRWDLLRRPADEAPVLLPIEFRAYALDPRVGLPHGHPWSRGLPDRWPPPANTEA